jgi:hypothetical protein
MLLALVAFSNGVSASGTTDLTRLRLVLTEQGTQWSGLWLLGTRVEEHRVVASSPGAYVSRGLNYIGLSGEGNASATVDVVLSVPDYAAPRLELRKSKTGTTTAKVIRTNSDSVTLADMTNNNADGSTVAVDISRSTFVGEGLNIPAIDPRKLVLAFYYPWWDDSDFKGAMWYDKPTGPYRTDDPAEVLAMVDQARWAGVNGFIFSWDGLTGSRLDLVMDAAEQRPGFLVATALEVLNWKQGDGFDIDGIVAGARMALGRASSPAYLTSGGRPVMYVFGATQMGPADWNTVVTKLASTGVVPFFMGESGDPAYGFDGFYKYNPNGTSGSKLKSDYQEYAYRLRLPAQLDASKQQLLWAASVSPGMDDFYIRPLNSTRENRRDGARYDDTWYAAVGSDPEWILITSWNEWYETTQIQPSDRFGQKALDQTRTWSARWLNPQVGAAPSDDGGLLPIGLPGKLGMKSL